MELSLLKETQAMRGTPQINPRSKRLAEKRSHEVSKVQSPLNGVPKEAYSRLYDLGKQRVHLRNESQFNNGDGASTPMKRTNQSNGLIEVPSMQQSVIKSEHSFKP